MSDFIDDIDQDLLGLFEDHQEIVSLSILSILNSLGPIQLMRNEYWQHTRIDTNDHFERRIHDDSFKRTYRMDFNSFLVLYDMLFPFIDHDIRFSRHGERRDFTKISLQHRLQVYRQPCPLTVFLLMKFRTSLKQNYCFS